MLVGNTADSAQLERYRRLRGDLVELELGERRGELRRASDVKALWTMIVNRLQVLSKTLAAGFGRKAGRQVDDAVRDMDRETARMSKRKPK